MSVVIEILGLRKSKLDISRLKPPANKLECVVLIRSYASCVYAKTEFIGFFSVEKLYEMEAPIVIETFFDFRSKTRQALSLQIILI